MRLLFALALACLCASAQNNQYAPRDPLFRVLTDFPGRCTEGDVITRGDQTYGQNSYICGKTNNWVLMSGSGASTTGTSVQKANGSGGLTAAGATDVVELFSTCSGIQYLGADGACHSGGSGTIPGIGTTITASRQLDCLTDAANVAGEIPVNGTNVTLTLPSGCTAGTRFWIDSAGSSAVAFNLSINAVTVTQNGATSTTLASLAACTTAPCQRYLLTVDSSGSNYYVTSAGVNGTNGTNGSNGAGYSATSSTSQTVGTGSKTFTTQSGLAYVAGSLSYVTICSSSTPTACMFGNITSYSGTSLVVNVTSTSGSGTLTDWLITVSGLGGSSKTTTSIQLPIGAATFGASYGGPWNISNSGVTMDNFLGWALTFSASGTEQAQTQFRLPHNFDNTQAGLFEYSISDFAGSGGNARFLLTLSCVANAVTKFGYSSLPQYTGSTIAVTNRYSYSSITVPAADLQTASCAADQIVYVQVFRDNTVASNSVDAINLYQPTVVLGVTIP